MIAAVSNGEAIVALLILVVVAAMFVLMFVDLDALVCELQEDGTEVGVESVLADSSLGVDGNDTRLGADTFRRPYDQDAA